MKFKTWLYDGSALLEDGRRADFESGMLTEPEGRIWEDGAHFHRWQNVRPLTEEEIKSLLRQSKKRKELTEQQKLTIAEAMKNGGTAVLKIAGVVFQVWRVDNCMYVKKGVCNPMTADYTLEAVYDEINTELKYM